jgi:hypothetical protein
MKPMETVEPRTAQAGEPSKTFVLGVGAQKCGTTWLHSYLAGAPNVDVGVVKEYHVWDTIAIPACRRFRVEGSYLLNRLRHPFDRVTPVKQRLQRRPELYFDYFAGLLGRNGIEVTADITPAYCGLPVEILSTIREGFAARGISTRAVFLMRDPVDRVWSHFRMLKQREKSEGREAGFYAGTEAELPHFAQTEDCRFRTDYPTTIANLRAVFPERDIHFGFYETMFQEPEIERLSRFVGITPRPTHAKKKVFEGSALGLSASKWEETREVLAPIYRACAELFPITKDLWAQSAGRFEP